MMFQAGDAVVHPARGAGVIERIVDREWRGVNRSYYTISLLNHPGTRVMIPAAMADKMGLRHAACEAELTSVWRVFEQTPGELPADHKERYQAIAGRLSTGGIVDVAEIVRDLAWRQQVKGHLTIKGARIYDEAMAMLAGEVAAAKGISFVDAEKAVRGKLAVFLEPSAAD